MAAPRLVAYLALFLFPALSTALDCRKFSFAPACRGIMLKRSLADAPELAVESHPVEAERADVRLAVLKTLFEEMDREGLTTNACVTPTWIMRKLLPRGEEQLQA